MDIKGIHHVTAISSDAQKTYDFYSKVLGLRLIKKSVNQDDVLTYHLFFGNKKGTPGLDMTFFPFKGVPPGKQGTGQVTTVSFVVPVNSLIFWEKRFKDLEVRCERIKEKFGYKRMMFYDNDNQRLELVEVPEIESEYAKNVWTKDISAENAICAFHGATLSVMSEALITPVLKVFGYELQSTDEMCMLYKLPDRTNTVYLQIEELPLEIDVINGSGTVHHIAFGVENREIQEKVRQQIIDIGLYPTHVIDRFYFTSVYFRTSAGILFEIATEGPGFTADENEATLGEKLALPPFLEDQRETIEQNLSPLRIG